MKTGATHSMIRRAKIRRHPKCTHFNSSASDFMQFLILDQSLKRKVN